MNCNERVIRGTWGYPSPSALRIQVRRVRGLRLSAGSQVPATNLFYANDLLADPNGECVLV
jgi:hypothetical protein